MGQDRGESVAVVSEWGGRLIVEGDMLSHIELGNRRAGGITEEEVTIPCDLTNMESFYHGIVGTLADRGFEQASQSDR